MYTDEEIGLMTDHQRTALAAKYIYEADLCHINADEVGELTNMTEHIRFATTLYLSKGYSVVFTKL